MNWLGPPTEPEDGRELARRTTIGTLVAVVALLVGEVAVGILAVQRGGGGAMDPFAAGALVGSAVVAGVGAAVVYAALDRLTGTPLRSFLWVAVAVFAVSLVPVALVSPARGVTPDGQVVLAVYHAVVAVALTAGVRGQLPV